MAKIINSQGNVWIQSDVPLSEQDKDTAFKKARDAIDKNANDDDDFLIKVIADKTNDKKGSFSLIKIKNQSDLILCLRCVLNSLYSIDPTLTEATVHYFFTHEAPQNNHKKDDNLH